MDHHTVIGTLAVDGWAVNLVQRGGAWVGCGVLLFVFGGQKNFTQMPFSLKCIQ